MLKMKTTEAILESLRDSSTWKIGIYGMGGSGKTSTMRFITNELKTSGEFDNIIWVTVSENFVLYRVQDEIALQLGKDIRAYAADELKRATWLRRRLKQSNKKFLVILDEVWEPIPLEKVGIPENKCKMVVATRSWAVCCEMEMHRSIRMELLSDAEAWDCFKSIRMKYLLEDVWDYFDGTMAYELSPELQPLAEELVRECAGLPPAILAVISALNDNVDTSEVWRQFLMVLKSSPTKVRGMKAVFDNLRLSYMHLKSNTVRKCFLHLAFFPKDQLVEVNELISYWIAEFITEEADFETKSNICFMIMNQLLDVGLFDKYSSLDTDYITMHNLTRGLAISILKEEDNVLIKAGLELIEPPKRNEWKKPRKMSLMNNMIRVLPNQPNCPNLSILLLRENPLSQNISSSFFRQMYSLEILDLSDTRISELPSSLSKLHNLHALFLQGCTSLKKIPSLAKLEKLQILNLSRTSIKELPQGMEGLSSLSTLNLSYTLDLEMDWIKVDKETKISSKRNQIDVFSDQPKWSSISNLLLQGNPLLQKISFSILNQMPNLEILDLSNTSITDLPFSLSDLLNLRALFIQDCILLKKIPSLEKLKKLRKLNLSRTGIKELPHGMEGLASLSSLDLSFTNDLEMDSLTIDEEKKISATKNQFNVLCDQLNWSNLSSLSLRGNHHLQKIYSPFFNHTPALEILDLSQTSISELPSSISDLLELRALCLQECTYLEKMPSLGKLKKLRMLDLSHTPIKNLPQGVEELTRLTSLDCSFTYQLESCVITELTLLEELHMEGSKAWMTDSVSLFKSIEEMRGFNHMAVLTMSFVKLEDYLKAFSQLPWGRLQNFGFRLSDSMDLSVLYPTEFGPKFIYFHNQKICSYTATLLLPPKTEELQLSLCEIPRLSELFCLRNLRFLIKCNIERCSLMSGNCLILGDEMEEQSLASLQNLSVKNVRGLTALCRGVVSNPFLTNLRVLEVHSCGNMKHIFASSILSHLKNIKVIEITQCGLLEEIASDVQSPEDIGNTTSGTIVLPTLQTLILIDLPKLCTISRMMWVCASLCNVEVRRCQRLKKLHFSVDYFSSLKYIQGEKKWWDALEWDNAKIKPLLQSRFRQTEQRY